MLPKHSGPQAPTPGSHPPAQGSVSRVSSYKSKQTACALGLKSHQLPADAPSSRPAAPLTTGPLRLLRSSHSCRQAGMQVAFSLSRITRSSGRSSILCSPRSVSLLSISGLQWAGQR